MLAAAKFGYKSPGAAVRVDAAREVTGELATTLQGVQIVNGPRVDDSAWLSQMTPKDSPS